MDARTSALVDQVQKLSPEQAFHAYTELLEKAPQQAQAAALALREKARAGELPDECIGVLDACLAEAPDSMCVVHLAKALAAFGRKAQPAAPTLVVKIKELHVTDDVGYWTLDGCLFALGFLGGSVARRLVDELAAEDPNRAVRSDSVYDGDLDKEERHKRFHECLARVLALLDQKDPGVWRERAQPAAPATSTPVQPAKPGASKKSWMVR